MFESSWDGWLEFKLLGGRWRLPKLTNSFTCRHNFPRLMMHPVVPALTQFPFAATVLGACSNGAIKAAGDKK
jgi:hypothetical protein